MQVRQPRFDFAGVNPVWADDVVAVHMVNAQGVVPAYVEPFLIKVMQRAKARLDPDVHAELVRDLDVFNRQEAQHYKFHLALNRWVRDNGYDGMGAYEARYAAEYDEMLATKSLRWLLAYCEGFESMGLATAHAFVDGDLEALLPNADPRPLALWRWHLAEEYEHRTVAFRVLKALYGGNALTFYVVRVSGLLHANRHIAPTVRAVHRYLVRAHAAQAGRARRSSRRRWPWVRLLIRMVPAAIRPLSPFYDPARVAPPGRLHEALGAATGSRD